jgi:hypothetical protein
MQDGAAVGGLLCGLVIGIGLWTAVGAVFLRAGISFYNKFANELDSTRRVPEPTFGRAMGITFVSAFVNAVVGFVVGLALANPTAAQDAAAKRWDALVPQLAAVPISLLVLSALLSAMLPTTFGRAVLVVFCYVLMVIFVAGLLGFAVLMLGELGLIK